MDVNKIRKWNRIIHRDLGYIAVGLSLVYAISGVVVNHILFGVIEYGVGVADVAV